MRFSQSTAMFVFGDFKAHRKNWLTYSGWKLCYNFSISNDLTQMANFPTQIPNCDSHNPALLDLFLSSDACISSAMAFKFWWWSYFCFNFHLVSIKLETGWPVSSDSLWQFSCWLGWSLWWFERSSMGGHL